MQDPVIQFIAQSIRGAFPFGSNVDAPAIPHSLNWDAVRQCAEENAVAPLLYASLKGHPGDQFPQPFIERLRIEFLRADTANWVALRQLQSLGAEFQTARIPAIALKGGALATTLYPDPALRPMSDLDFLIPRSQFADADALMRAQGFKSPVELTQDFAPRWTNYRAYARGGKDPAHIELHWHLFKSPYYWMRVPIEWFWEHTTEMMIQQQSIRVFSREAQFLHLAAHFALHHRSERLLWSYDLARWIARDRAVMDWDLLVETSERFGLAIAVRAALAQVSETWGVRAPDAATARWNASRPGWQDRTAFALMNARRGEARFLLDLVSLSGVNAKWQFLWYHLFPARAYMRDRYHVQNLKIPFFYLWRLADGILKLFRSLFLYNLIHFLIF